MTDSTRAVSGVSAREAPRDADTLDALIQHAYLAAADPQHWRVFLEAMQRELGAASAFLTFTDMRRPQAFVQAAVGVEAQAVREYHDRWAALDPFVQFSKANGLFLTGLIALAQDYFADDAFAGTEFWERFARPNGYIGGVQMTLIADGDMLGMFGANRRPGRHFGRREVDLLEALLPHLQTALQITRSVTLDFQIGHAAIATLGRLRTPTFVCDALGRVVFHNTAARSCTVLEIRDGRLIVRHGEGPPLQRAIAGVTDACAPAGDVVVAIDDATGRSVPVVVARIPQDERLPFGHQLAAVLVAGSAADALAAFPQAAAALRFTPAESALARRLLIGDTIADAARQLGISVATARTHLKRLFRKAGVHRQPELIRVLLTQMVDRDT